MLAVLALVAFVLAVFGVNLGDVGGIRMVALGLAFLAVHLLAPWPSPGSYPWRRQ